MNTDNRTTTEQLADDISELNEWGYGVRIEHSDMLGGWIASTSKPVQRCNSVRGACLPGSDQQAILDSSDGPLLSGPWATEEEAQLVAVARCMGDNRLACEIVESY